MSGDGGTVAGPPRTTDELAAQLRADPVALDQVLGSGRTAELDARLTRLQAEVARQTDVPVYVVAVQPPTDTQSEDPSKDLAVTLPRRVGDGVYLLDCGDVPQVAVRGTTVDETGLSLALFDARNQVEGSEMGGSLLPPAVQAATVLELVRTQDARILRDGPSSGGDDPQILSDAQIGSLRELAVLTAEPERPSSIGSLREEPATTGDLAVWGATSGVVVLVVVYLTLRRAWPGTRGLAAHLRRRPAGLGEGERAELDRQARRNLDELTRRIGSAGRIRDEAAMERAIAAREVVEHLLPTTDDRELVGALTLTRVGLGDVRTATRRRARPWRPCFVDPRHGEADGESAFELDDATLEVPVCRDCASALRRDRPLRPFRPSDEGRGRPYYAADDVWARTGFGALDGDVAHVVLRERAGLR